MTPKQERRLRSFEALQMALAIEDAKHMPNTPELERSVEALYAFGRRKMAQLRYAENVLWPVKIVSNEIRPEVLALSRDEAIATLADVCLRNPQMQFAHRDCETLSDHDIKSMLEDALRVIEGKE